MKKFSMKKIRYLLFVGILALSVVWLIYGVILSRDKEFTLNELKTLNEVDQVRVFHDDASNGEGYLVKTIEDPAKINKVVNIFSAYATGWQYRHWPASPPGPLTIEFYKKKELLALIDITHYIPASGDSSFYLSKFPGPDRPLEESEFKELMSILEVDEGLALSNPIAH